MPHKHSTLRALTIGTLAAALTIGALAATTAPASALPIPGDLKSDIRNSSTAVLSWGSVKKATSYEIQIDAASSFASPDYTANTTNTKAVPTKALIPGKNFWRVRSVSGSTRSDWANGSFTVAPVTVPIPLAPENGAVLQQPQSPPLLQWSSSQGAVSYSVSVDGDADMIGAKVYSTKTTSMVVPDPLTVGDWYWQVTAVKGTGLVSLPSAVSRFDISPLAQPQLTYPANDVSQTIQDVVLDWEPVPGAKTYDVQVAIDQDFNAVVMDVKNVYGTRYSPPTTLRNGAFWWRVRAVDLAGQQTPWSTSQFTFTRDWLNVTTAVFPTGDTTNKPDVTAPRQYYQWTPVQHASYYELYVASDEFGTNGDVCYTAGTTYVPRNAADCGFKSSGPTFWRVRAMDKPYPDIGVPGIVSAWQAFTWVAPVSPVGTFVKGTVPANLRVAVAGNALDDPTKACFDELCDAVPATPVWAWDPVPGATSYNVYVSLDKNFTFKALGGDAFLSTTSTAVALTHKSLDDVSTLPESDVGNSYFWYVVACGPTGCGTPPVSQNPPLPGWRSFRKVSPAVTGLSASNVTGSDITFDWQDYIVANSNSSLWRGQMGTQAAQTYRIQVDNDPSFATPVDTAIVDQTTYTAPNDLYPEGTYFWRVQARDMGNNFETWSQVQTFTKASPAVSLSTPVGGALVSGTTPFRWAAQPFASGYTIEAYKNNDLTFSQANRVVAATVKTVAYTPSSPIPASDLPYVWRVRKIDTSGNPGAWSATGTFFSSGAAPGLLTPKAGIWLKNAGALFEWTEVPGAATYKLNITGTKNSSVATVATAYAPSAQATGSYTWSVTAYDGAGNPLATSATRQYKVDATAPFIKKFKPDLGELKAKSTIKATFSEKVRGISGKSIKMYKAKGKKWVKIKVKIKALKKGKVASIDPKGRLKSGDYQIRFSTKLIKDVHGNSLVPSDVASQTSARVRADLRIGR